MQTACTKKATGSRRVMSPFLLTQSPRSSVTSEPSGFQCAHMLRHSNRKSSAFLSFFFSVSFPPFHSFSLTLSLSLLDSFLSLFRFLFPCFSFSVFLPLLLFGDHGTCIFPLFLFFLRQWRLGRFPSHLQGFVDRRAPSCSAPCLNDCAPFNREEGLV